MTVSKLLCWKCFDRILPAIMATVTQAIDNGVLRRVEPGDLPCSHCGSMEASIVFKKEIKLK